MKSVDEAFAIALGAHQAGRAEEAAVVYERILRERPDHAGSWHLLGLVCRERGDLEQAKSHIARAIALDATKAVYHNNLGVVLRGQRRLREAEEAYRKALSIKYDYADAWSNLGVVLQEQGEYHEAFAAYRQALFVHPTHPDAFFNLGNLYQESGQANEAIPCYQQALEVQPNRAATHNNLGNALLAERRSEEAIGCYRRALELEPDYAEAHLNLGMAYAERERVEKAARCYERASDLRPDRPLWRLRSASLCPVVFQDVGELDRYRRGLEATLDAWLGRPVKVDWRELATDGFAPSFHLPHHGRNNRRLLEKFAAVFEPCFPESRPQPRGGRPRIGFLVNRRHEGGFLRGTGGIIERLDAARFEPVVLCSESALDTCRRSIRRADILTSANDVLGNTTTFSYTDADSDGQTDDPTQVVDAWRHTTSFAYTSGRLSTITDFTSRVTTMGYDGSARLTSITEPDPDGGGPLSSPVWEFGYDGTTNLLTSVTDPADKTTEFDYDFARTLAAVTHPDETTDTLSAIQVQALVDTTVEGTQGNPAGLFRVEDLEGSRQDELEHELTFTTGPFGQVTSTTDDAGSVTTYEYDDQGRLTRLTQPDPDGAGPLASPVYEYQYDSNGNLTQTTFPDDSTQTWTYNTTFNRPTSFTDELGHQTLYTLDPLNGNTLSVRRVVGEVDTPENEETDDVVTSYTYTAQPATSSDPPAGLVATQTDPLGRVTRYIYNSHGLVTMTVYALGTADQAVVQYQYNSADDLTAQIDELGRTTSYTYDNLHRRTSMTQPDPDGGGPLSAPVTYYEYDAAGRLTEETDPLGRTTEYTYDDLGRVTRMSKPDHDGDQQRTNTDYTYTDTGQVYTVTDPLGRVTTYGYDALDRRTSTTQPDPDGEGPLASPVTEYAYDNLGRLIQVTDALDRVTTFEYNSRGWKTKMIQPDPDGAGPLSAPVWQYGYNTVGSLTSETDPLSHVTTRAYDALNRLTSITQPDPDGGGPLSAPVRQYAYDNAGNQTSVTDPLSRVTTYTYDNRNRQTQRTLPDPDGGGPLTSPVYKTSYDAAGQVVSETDPLGNVTSYEYDNLGRRIEMTQPDPDGGGPLSAPVTQYAYDAAGNLTGTTDPLGRVTEQEYDALYNMIEVTQPDPDGEGPLEAPVTSYEYDAAGQVISETDPLGNVTSYEYDNLGRTMEMAQPDPDGEGPLTSAVTEYAYDAAGNLTSQTDPLEKVTSYEYDNLNRQVSVTDPESGETTYTYDAAGNRLSLTDPVGSVTSWTYDNLNRVTEETNELEDSRLFEYDAIGHLTKRTDRNGRVIEYTFDNLGRNTAELWKDGETTVRTFSYAYDAASQLTSASDPDAEYTYEYDDLGRVTSIAVEIDGLAPTIVFAQAFDAAGNRSSLAATIGEADDFLNEYTYDNLARMTRIEQSGQEGGNAVAEKRIDLAYDAASQWDTIARYADLAGTDLVVESSWTYDNASRLTALSHTKGESTLAGYTWTFDSAGRVTQFDSETDGSVDYTYDDTGQLTGADYDYQTDESYTYDANGNRTNTGYATGDDNRMTSDGTYTYTYDAEGNRTARFVDEDESGTLNTGDTDITEYTWDYRNRLTTVTERATYGGSASKVTDFAYDYLNRLVSESADPDGAGEQGAEETYFAYDGNQIVLQFDGSEAGDLSHRYLWGPAVDQILADEEVTSLETEGDVLWPLADNLGTVRDLATYDSQEDETTVANHRVYDAYGKLTSETNSAIDHLFGYTGRQFDEATGLQNNLNRWYDPVVARWLSEDPSGFTAGDTNLYRYVANQPTGRTDSSGLVYEWTTVGQPQEVYWQSFTVECEGQTHNKIEEVLVSPTLREYYMSPYKEPTTVYRIDQYKVMETRERENPLKRLAQINIEMMTAMRDYYHAQADKYDGVATIMDPFLYLAIGAGGFHELAEYYRDLESKANDTLTDLKIAEAVLPSVETRQVCVGIAEKLGATWQLPDGGFVGRGPLLYCYELIGGVWVRKSSIPRWVPRTPPPPLYPLPPKPWK